MMMIKPRNAARRLAVSAAVGVGVLGLGVASAVAAPSNAPTAISGMFFGCTNGDSGTFVTNSGNNHALQTWNSAKLTFASGGHGVFIPTTLDLSFNGQSAGPVSKGNTTGTVTCQILALVGPNTLSGTVTGNIVPKG
jgi:hypothetical protein